MKALDGKNLLGLHAGLRTGPLPLLWPGAIRTACCCIRSLRIRVEARANVTEREVLSRQLQLMQASVQHYPTEDLNTADTSCLSRTSAEHFDDRSGPCLEENARIPVSM